MKNSLVILGGLVALVGGGMITSTSLKRTNFEMLDASLAGYHIEKTDGLEIPVFCSSEGNKLALINKDRSFVPSEEYSSNPDYTTYDIKGYKNFWGNYAKTVTKSSNSLSSSDIPLQ